MVYQLSYMERVILREVGREEALYNRSLREHGCDDWRRAAFSRIAALVTQAVRLRPGGDANFSITGMEVKTIYTKLRKQYNSIQIKLHSGLWVRERLTVRNIQLLHTLWYLHRHMHHRGGWANHA